MGIGPTVMVTQPLIAARRLPYPVDPTYGHVATLDELVSQAKVSKAMRDAEEPIEA